MSKISSFPLFSEGKHGKLALFLCLNINMMYVSGRKCEYSRSLFTFDRKLQLRKDVYNRILFCSME